MSQFPTLEDAVTAPRSERELQEVQAMDDMLEALRLLKIGARLHACITAWDGLCTADEEQCMCMQTRVDGGRNRCTCSGVDLGLERMCLP